VKHPESPLVYLVDDDEAVRDSLGMLFRSIGLAHEAYASALDFLQHYDAARLACLVADIRMPGLSGLELQQRLNEQRAEIPIIFITGHGDVPMAVTAMKSGAADFIQKPFRDQELIDLTPREKEVMQRVVRGQANKVIAMDLGVSQRTVELHRARVMRKLKMRSLAELVHAVDKVAGAAAPSGTAVPQ
jgi:two-component system, LuxR family, response regulator FixJ